MSHHTVHSERSAGYFRNIMDRSLSEPGLSPDDRLLIWISSASAAVHEEFLQESLRRALTAGLPVIQIKEVILQNYLFCGFPVAIEGLSMLSRLLPETAASDMNFDDQRDEETQNHDGLSLCRKVYDQNYERLMDNMSAMSTDLKTWMIREGYGKVLSRPVLPIRTREFCIVAALITIGRSRQLHSHLRGALNVGASTSQLNAVLETVRPFVREDFLSDAETLLEKLT